MCGFVGLYDPDGVGDEDRRLIVDASARISHRGPDEVSRLSDDSIEVTFRRLSIIDVANGHQPARTEADGLSVLLNGEIYNHREIRRDLERSGHRFRSKSDVEVIPHLIEQDGIAGIGRLEGMYAIAAFDHDSQTLHLSRDQFGIKPLYVSSCGRRITFGSELKALLALPWVEKAVSWDRLRAYHSSLFAHGELTPFDGIDRLPVALIRTYDGDTCRDTPLPCFSRARAIGCDRGDLDCEDLEQSLLHAIERQVVADVPLGVSLSGGIDSGIIAAGLQRLGRSDVRAFNIRFDDAAAARDSDVAKSIAEHCGLDIRTESVDDEDFFVGFARNIWLLDEPIGDPAYVSALKVSELVSSEAKVLLSGCGGDEVFGGYGHMLRGGKLRLLSKVPSRKIRRWLIRAGDKVAEERMVDALVDFESEPWKISAETRTIFLPGAERPSSLARYLQDIACLNSEGSRFDKARRMEMSGYLEGQLLPMLDKATMGWSIEGRVPLLDELVVAAGFGLRNSLEARDFGSGKPALRRIAEEWLPEEVLDLPKTGFSSPISRVVVGQLERIQSILVSSSIFPWLDEGGRLSAALGSRSIAMQRYLSIYSALVLAVWHRIYVEHGGRDPGLATLETLFEIPTGRVARR